MVSLDKCIRVSYIYNKALIIKKNFISVLLTLKDFPGKGIVV